jgi:transcriptional regulator with XRE-family HTH domain
MTTAQTPTGTLRDQVAEEIRVQLARMRMSARQLTQLTGWSPMYLSRRLRGELPFSIDDLELIAYVLQIPVTRLLPRSEDGFITRAEWYRPGLRAA